MGGPDRSKCAVRVAVRVRPFRKKIDPPPFNNIIRMENNNTFLRNPDTGDEQRFDFDWSFWSCDDKHKDAYDQQRLYDVVGSEVLQDIWDGYHVCLFSYGQSGSGKSYTMTGGSKRHQGMVPRMCEGLINRIKAAEKNSSSKFTLSVSMLEVYMEKINDLLSGKKDLSAFRTKNPAKPDEPPQYMVPKLTRHSVETTEQMMALLERGERRRAVGATGLNERSSRAHTIFELTLEKRDYEEKLKEEKVRTTSIKLIDLAGTERMKKSRATGLRKKEGAAINTSLTYLGLCINQLAEATNNKSKSKKEAMLKKIPWSHTVLTRLLQHSLTGKAKTIMIAALTPGHYNYLETLSTLRYAARMKSIRNPDPKPETSEVDKLMQNLAEAEKENAALRKMLANGATAKRGSQKDQLLELQAMLSRKEEELGMLKQIKQNRVDADANEVDQELQDLIEQNKKRKRMKKECPYLSQLHPDASLSNKVVHFLSEGTTRVGNPVSLLTPANKPKDDNNDDDQDQPGLIRVHGLRMKRNHAIIQCNTKKDTLTVTIEPAAQGAEVTVNGKAITETTKLHNYDRVVLGNQNYFLFHTPGSEDSELEEQYDFEYTHKEMMSDAMASFLGDAAEDNSLESKLKELSSRIAKEKARTAMQSMSNQRKLEEEKKKREAEYNKRLEQAKLLKRQSDREKEIQKIQKQEAAARQRLEKKAEEIEKARAKQEEEMKALRKQLDEYEAKRQAEDKEMTVKEAQKKLLQYNLVKALGEVRDANDIADAMNQPVKYSIKIMSGKYGLGEHEGSQIYVRVQRTDVKMETYWHLSEFDNHMQEIRDLYMMMEMNGVAKVPESDVDNPFLDDPDKPIPLGEAEILLAALHMLIGNDSEKAPIMDYTGKVVGHIHFSILPKLTESDILEFDDLDELAAKKPSFEFDVVIDKLTGLTSRCIGKTHVTFQLPSFARPVGDNPALRKGSLATTKHHLHHMFGQDDTGGVYTTIVQATEQLGDDSSDDDDDEKGSARTLGKLAVSPSFGLGLDKAKDHLTSVTDKMHHRRGSSVLQSVPEPDAEITMKSYFTAMCQEDTANPNLEFKQTFRISPITKAALLWCKNSTLDFEAWGSLPRALVEKRMAPKPPKGPAPDKKRASTKSLTGRAKRSQSNRSETTTEFVQASIEAAAKTAGKHRRNISRRISNTWIVENAGPPKERQEAIDQLKKGQQRVMQLRSFMKESKKSSDMKEEEMAKRMRELEEENKRLKGPANGNDTNGMTGVVPQHTEKKKKKEDLSQLSREELLQRLQDKEKTFDAANTPSAKTKKSGRCTIL